VTQHFYDMMTNDGLHHNITIFAASRIQMSIEQQLHERSGSACELCAGTDNLHAYEVSPAGKTFEGSILVCHTCLDQLLKVTEMDQNHWRCLNTSMWSTVPAVQVVAWRILNSLRHEGWPQDLLDMLYLDDETLAWAKAAGQEDIVTDDKIIHKDSNGAVIQSGDTVVLIKDLDIKGGGFTAKRGTAVRGISLVENNAGQIEGKINGQQIVILTQFVKKSG
jgi:protein PhnA